MSLNLDKRENITNLMKEMGFLTINQILKFEILNFMQKYDSNQLPTAFSNLLVNKHHSIARRTRSNSKFLIPFFSKSLTQQSIRYIGPKLWSELPPYLRNLTTSKFIKKLKPFILNYKNN
jgi:hypothetical protein